MNFTAIILAGGKSSRMGRDKAWLKVGGQTLLARQIQLARDVGASEIFISGREETDYSEFDCPVLRDKFAGAGPLAGIERALAGAASPLVLVLAVDLPAVGAGLLQRLKAGCTENIGAIPHVEGKLEPLVAFYPKAAASLAEMLLRAGENAVTTFAQQCARSGLACFLDLTADDMKYFTNWNLPSDVPKSPAL